MPEFAAPDDRFPGQGCSDDRRTEGRIWAHYARQHAAFWSFSAAKTSNSALPRPKRWGRPVTWWRGPRKPSASPESARSSLELVVPAGLKADRLLVIGTGKSADLQQQDFVNLGGAAMGKLPKAAAEATVFADLPGGAMSAEQAADLAQGAGLRAYAFDRYKTKRKDDDKPAANRSVTIATADVAGARKAFAAHAAVAGGVLMARDLVNEPANILYPEEFARRAAVLKKAGVAVEVLDMKALKKLGMGALLGRRPGFARAKAASSSCAGTAARRARRRSPSSARACASTPAAFRSRAPPAWRT